MLSVDNQSGMFSMEELGAVRAEHELRKEVEELRRDVSSLRVRAENSAPREALLEERSVRELGEGAVRQITAKLEEAMARETVALRADNADLRSSLTEALKLLGDERKERQADVADGNRRLKDFQAWSEDKTQRLESLARGSDARTSETKQNVMEVERLRDLTEFRAIAAVAEEGRNREQSLQVEMQAREGLIAEVEARIRASISEEKQIRNRCVDDLVAQFQRLEEGVRQEREVQSQRNAENVGRIEDCLRGVYEEGRRRQSDMLNLNAQVDDTRALLKSEARDRGDANDAIFKRSSSLESALEQLMDRCDSEQGTLRQNVAELRAACQVEATVREESVARIHGLLDEEARAREEAQSAEASQREQSSTRLEQYCRTAVAEQRQQREDGEGDMEGKLANLQHEHNFEKAKAAAQARELAQAVSQAREAIGAETAARRHEVNLMVRGMDEVRENFTEQTTIREKVEGRLTENFASVDKALRDECSTREVIERKALGERTELQDGMQRLARAQTELEISVQTGFNEERRLREEGEQREDSLRNEGDLKLATTLQELVKEESEIRDKELRILDRRMATAEQGRNVDTNDHEEEKRGVAVRLSTMSDNLSEARAEMRKALQKCDDFATLRETLLAESTNRQSEERSLEMAVKEQQVKVEQLQRSREQAERKFDSKLADMVVRLDGEADARTCYDMKYAKQMSDFVAEHTNIQQSDLRRLEDIIAKASKTLNAQAFEERGLRERAIATVENKTLELREGVDEVRKWRVEQYNELVFEIAKLGEMVTEEAKARQQQDQVLAGEVRRLGEETVEEANARKFAIVGMNEEVKDVLVRLERERQSVEGKERDRQRAIEILRDDLTNEGIRREAADFEIRQGLDKEVLVREELATGSNRAWQKAIAKTNEDWRATLRDDQASRENAQLRLDQALVEMRTNIEESRAVVEQREDEIRQRFKVAAEQLQMEEVSRKTEDLLLSKAVEDLRNICSADQGESASRDQRTADRFMLLENQLRDEALLREDCERRGSQDAMDIQVRLQAEQAAREESDARLDLRINVESATREDLLTREVRTREEADNFTMDAWQKTLREEQLLRERDRKELVSRLQTYQNQQQEEHEDRVKSNRDLTVTIAKLQSVSKEEEESRIEQGERQDSAIDAIHNAVRLLGPQREEILKKCMESVDQVRSVVNKEVVARSTKTETLDDALRDVRQRLNDEVQLRESGVRTVEEAILEERTLREDALVKERRAAEEEVQKTFQISRKTREEEMRKVQERIMEVNAGINEERDMRQEALRVERQKLLDTKEVFGREQKLMEREVAKMSQQILRQWENDTQRSKEVDIMLNSVLEKCESVRGDFINEVSRRQNQLTGLEQRMLESNTMITSEVKDRLNMGDDMRKAMDEQFALGESNLGMDRRAREAADVQVANSLKVALRDERDARESEATLIIKELNSVKSQLSDETGHREDDRSQQSLATQKLRTDIQELLSERKVDVVAMKEAFSQVTEELKVVQRTRKDDVDRLDNTMAGMSTRVDGNARVARDMTVGLEQHVQVLQADIHQEIDERQALVVKLDARISEEKRILEASVTASVRNNDECLERADEAARNRQYDGERKQQALLDQLGLQLSNIVGDLEKSRSSGGEQARELARGIAAMNGALSAEEQARQQSAWTLQQGLDSVREEIVMEAKERRVQAAGVSEELQNRYRLVSQRDERVDLMVQKISAEAGELRERVSREMRQREAAVAQVEQRLLSYQGVRNEAKPGLEVAGYPSNDKTPPSPSPAGGNENPSGAPWREFQRQTDDDLQKQKRLIEGLLSEQQGTVRSVSSLSERMETVRTALTAVQTAVSETGSKQRAVGDIDLQVRMSREDLAKEAKERHADTDRLSRLQVELVDRFEATEQKKLTIDNDVQQELLDTKNTLKKETRDREMALGKVSSAMREETQKREEAIEREERARQESQQRSADSFSSALREERRAREKENLRLEGRSISAVKTGVSNDFGQTGGIPEVQNCLMENRTMRNALGEFQERLSQTEMRQKSAEERTVSMLDAIMSGLTAPGE